jgi:hypothetical protein
MQAEGRLEKARGAIHKAVGDANELRRKSRKPPGMSVMKIIETLHKDELFSNAIVEVLEDEIADIDKMLAMVDHVVGQGYSANVRLLSIGEQPEVQTMSGMRLPLRQRHLLEPDSIRPKKRYYEVALASDLTH